MSADSRPARTGAIVAAIVLGLFLVLLATQIGGGGGTRSSQLVGGPVPEFDLPILDGGSLASSDLAGTTYLVNFWNEWCIPCRQEHPALVAFDAAHRDDPGVRLIGIVRDERSLEAVREYVATEGVTWTVLLDPGGDAKVAFGTTGQPETFAIDAGGVVRDYQYGPATEARLEEMLATAGGR